MFPRTFFPGRFFAPLFWPQSQGEAPTAPVIDNRNGTGAANRNVTATGAASRNVTAVGRAPNV